MLILPRMPDHPKLVDAITNLPDAVEINPSGQRHGMHYFLYHGVVTKAGFPTAGEMEVAVRRDGWSTLVKMKDQAIQVGNTVCITSVMAGPGHVPSFRLSTPEEIELVAEAPAPSPTP